MQSLFAPLSSSHMNKKMNNMVEAAQPAPPSVTEFLRVLTSRAPDRPTSDVVFGNTFNESKVDAPPAGSKGVHAAGTKVALDFEVIRNLMGATSESLDVVLRACQIYTRATQFFRRYRETG